MSQMTFGVDEERGAGGEERKENNTRDIITTMTETMLSVIELSSWPEKGKRERE